MSLGLVGLGIGGTGIETGTLEATAATRASSAAGSRVVGDLECHLHIESAF